MTTYPLERYLSTCFASSPSFGPDGQITFLRDVTGVPQVWELAAPGDWPRRRTFTDERVSFASWSPSGDELVFGMDAGGNERVEREASLGWLEQ